MRNFMEAYSAVHSSEAREELLSKRDEIAEMDLSMVSDSELEDICEEVLEELFDEGYTVEECEAIFTDVISEAKVTYGHDTDSTKAKKTARLEKGLKSAIGKVKMKAAKGAVKAYGAYRDAKASAKMKARRAGQTTKNMSAQVQRKGSEMKSKAKSGLKSMIKKGAMKVARGAVNVAKRMSEGKMADKDYDGDGKIETGTQEYMGSRDKAIKKAMNIRGNDSAAQKKRLEKKRGMKLDDHPQFKKEEVEPVDEAMRPGPRQRKMAAKMHDPYVRGGSKSRGQAHNIAVRGDVSTGDPAIKSRGGGGVKKDKGMGYGDRGAGNKARRRAGQEPLRGNTRKEELELKGFTESEIQRIMEVVDSWED